MAVACYSTGKSLIENTEELYITQNDLLMKNLITYYSDLTNMEKMISIINGQSSISLRIVDWFATNFSKKHCIIYNVNKNGEIIRFNVFNDYKLKLKAFSKKRFDPFCRWDRLTFPYKNGTYIQTTIGQLNFFKWALEYDIIDYIKNNYAEIESDMNSRNSQSRTKQNKTKQETEISSPENICAVDRKKRQELSLSAVKTIKKENIEIEITFN